MPAKSKNKQGDKKRYELSEDSDQLLLQIYAGEEPSSNQTIEDIYPTLVGQGSIVISLGKEYKRGTPVFVQMSYESETGEDHTKVPWLSVWIDREDGEPIIRRRSSEFR